MVNRDKIAEIIFSLVCMYVAILIVIFALNMIFTVERIMAIILWLYQYFFHRPYPLSVSVFSKLCTVSLFLIDGMALAIPIVVLLDLEIMERHK